MSAPMTSTMWKSLCSLGIDLRADNTRGGPPENHKRWLLTVRDGELAHRILLGGPPALLGSSAACDIQVDHPRVDDVHLQIVPHDEGALFRSAGGQGFDCHGAHQSGEVDVGFGTPVFVDDVLMLTLEPLASDT
jgi:hypothetical protein